MDPVGKGADTALTPDAYMRLEGRQYGSSRGCSPCFCEEGLVRRKEALDLSVLVYKHRGECKEIAPWRDADRRTNFAGRCRRARRSFVRGRMGACMKETVSRRVAWNCFGMLKELKEERRHPRTAGLAVGCSIMRRSLSMYQLAVFSPAICCPAQRLSSIPRAAGHRRRGSGSL